MRIKWTNDMVAREIMKIANLYSPPRMPSNAEVIEHCGNYKLSNAIQKRGGYAEWAERLGLELKKSDSYTGIKTEKEMAQKLADKGFEVESTTVKFPYDLLLNGCVKVDVKAANLSYVRDYQVHAYRVAKPQQTCDFYLFHELDTDATYVVPAHLCCGHTQVVMGIGSKKYEPYKEAWDLISKASEFYKGNG